jgi:probable F420-dependent oxidoreductase
MAAKSASERLGRIGIWSMELRFGDRAEALEVAAEMDELGFGTLWIPGGIDGAVLGDVDQMLAATKQATIATGILNIWRHEPKDVADWFNGLSADHQSRVMLGIGVSHSALIGDAWKKPVAVMRDFLEKLSAAGMAMDHTCVAALGPKMLELSRDLTAGTHPYLVTPEHSAIARKILGPGKLVAPEQGVVMETDPEKARELALLALTHYRQLPNYRNNWSRLGFTEDEIENADDRLIDGLFAWGRTEKIAERVNAHLTAGADHVCIQLIRGAMGGDIAGLRSAARELAAALL